MKRLLLPCLLVLVTSACSHSDTAMPTPADLSAARANLAFTCTHEADYLPPLNPEADQLFKYARYLQKVEGPKDYNTIARYYRIAAAYGHYKANSNLQQLVSEGFADSPGRSKETIALVEQLIKDGIPGGYYDMGHYLELGYGVEQNQEKALRYFRKAADMGNPDAQFRVAKLLAPIDIAPEIARQMRQCAMEQGHGEAANALAIHLSNDRNKQYAEAAQAFQRGVAAGDTLSALALEGGFEAPPPKDMYYLALANDPERSRRYHEVRLFFRRNDGRNPKVPDIDQIVPLPPAVLPAWDGTFQWEKEQAAAAPPPQPSDELIQRLAKVKNLDPATGLPLPPPPKTKLPLGAYIDSGKLCPQNGVWAVVLAKGEGAHPSEQRCREGRKMPLVTLYLSRGWLKDYLFGKEKVASMPVTWTLVAYTDEA